MAVFDSPDLTTTNPSPLQRFLERAAVRHTVLALIILNAVVLGLLSIAMVLLLVYYVFGVIAAQIFGDQFPDWFGTLGRSLYTLFQIMTLESWSMGIVRPLMEVFPHAWAFFIPFILVATFTMLNLFIGVIVSAMHNFASVETEATVSAVGDARDRIEADLHAEVRGLRAELAEFKQILQRQEAR